ncbi:MAG: 1-acyl-sn-glycerol-3-phosphate acyltransferase [Lachnospiraceae bacterium]|nr:1-acyl-sn-glycerol-3-phosphate acyltransferase [Lachnospiraceae bacterium]
MKLNLRKSHQLRTKLFSPKHALKIRPSIRTKYNVIPVFYACDDGYAKYLIVSITSLIAHASAKKKYNIHVLYTSMSDENMNKLLKLSTKNVSILFHDVSKELAKMKSKLAIRDYYSATTYYRFFIPDMFPEYDKALYIDADTIVLSDVAEFYNYHLGNNLVGAVQDMLVKNDKIYGKYVEDVLNVSRAAYFNAGVLLINLIRFRKNRIKNQFSELLNLYTFVVAQDQDYLNILCQDNILWVDSKWNVQMTEKQIREEDEIGIVHYNLAEKPWHYKNGKYADYFWRYAEKTSEYEEILAVLNSFDADAKMKDEQYGRNLLQLALDEIENDFNYHKAIIPEEHRKVTRQEIVEKIEKFEREGRFDEDVEEDPPGRMLMPDEIDYLHKDINARVRTRYAYMIARWFMNVLLSKRQLIIKDIVGIENYRRLKSGAIVTCNHFNAMDSFAMQIAYQKSHQRQRRRKFYRIIKEGNYTSFPGFFGFLMRNCNTLPLSSHPATMKKFMKAVKKLLQKGNFILIYPEQSMWWNYKKPKPLKKGGYTFAVEANVPVLPCFVTMQDSDVPGEGGFMVQEYTIHIGKPIYPIQGKSKAENVKYMMEENFKVWKNIYEKTYGVKLEYTCDKKPEA